MTALRDCDNRWMTVLGDNGSTQSGLQPWDITALRNHDNRWMTALGDTALGDNGSPQSRINESSGG